MPTDFPNMRSLEMCARNWKFRAPNKDESEGDYREALADFVEPKDFIESAEIRNKVGWDKFTDEQNHKMLERKMLRGRLKS